MKTTYKNEELNKGLKGVGNKKKICTDDFNEEIKNYLKYLKAIHEHLPPNGDFDPNALCYHLRDKKENKNENNQP